jgi:hypothetical protein
MDRTATVTTRMCRNCKHGILIEGMHHDQVRCSLLRKKVVPTMHGCSLWEPKPEKGKQARF